MQADLFRVWRYAGQGRDRTKLLVIAQCGDELPMQQRVCEVRIAVSKEGHVPRHRAIAFGLLPAAVDRVRVRRRHGHVTTPRRRRKRAGSLVEMRCGASAQSRQGGLGGVANDSATTTRPHTAT